MLGTERLLLDRERAAEHLDGLGVAGLRIVDVADLVERHRDLRGFRAVRDLLDRDRTLHDR